MSLVLDAPSTDEAMPEPTDDFADAYDADNTAEARLIEKLRGTFTGRTHKRVAFILRHVRHLRELTLITECDLLEGGMLPCHVVALKRAMAAYGLSLLSPRIRRITALRMHYGSVDAIPLRILFFDSPLPATLDKVKIRKLGTLLTLTSLQARTINRCGQSGEWTYAPLLDDDDLFEICIVLHECGLQLADGIPRK